MPVDARVCDFDSEKRQMRICRFLLGVWDLVIVGLVGRTERSDLRRL
jgi:hypothetical protein